MTLHYQLDNSGTTRRLGAAIGRKLLAGDLVALSGPLGAGKTSLVRGLVQSLIPDEESVPSPTYTLVQTYEAPDFPVWHFDLYRLESPDNIWELGWDETAAGVALVEWPDRAGPHLPDWRLDVVLEFKGSGRQAMLTPRGDAWQGRMDDLEF